MSSYASNKIALLNWLRYQKAKESGENLKSWWHSESGFGIAMAPPISYSLRSRYDSTYGWNRPSFDSSMTGSGKALLGYSVHGVSDHMLMRVGESAMISFSWGAQFYLLRYKMPYIYPESAQSDLPPSNIVILGVGIPVTVDFKWGCDVNWNPEKRFCAAVGAGIYPQTGFAGFGLFGNGGGGSKVSPYFYASMGIYAAGCWKVRASYIPGNITVFGDRTDVNGGITRSLSMRTQGGVFTVGISHCGYSGDWRNGRAWRVPARIFGGGSGRRGGTLNSMRLY